MNLPENISLYYLEAPNKSTHSRSTEEFAVKSIDVENQKESKRDLPRKAARCNQFRICCDVISFHNFAHSLAINQMTVKTQI
jgi:hypothetical protein